MARLHMICGITAANASGNRTTVRCRFWSDATDADIEKAKAIISGNKMKRKVSLPDYFSPADIGSYRLAGHLEYA